MPCYAMRVRVIIIAPRFRFARYTIPGMIVALTSGA